MIRRLKSFVVYAVVGFALMLGFNIVLTSCVTSEVSEVPAESVQSEATAVDDESYMAALGLMHGHLMVAKELMDKGDYEAALPHIGHPVEELYSDVEDGLDLYDVPQFSEQLNTLTELVELAPEDAKVQTTYDEVISSIDSAIAAVPAETASSPEFVHAVLGDILDTAGEEYEGAIADDQFVEVVEYQDSRGFVLYANDFYNKSAAGFPEANAAASQTITENLEALKVAWPDVTPPAVPVISPDEVSGIIEDIKEAGS